MSESLGDKEIHSKIHNIILNEISESLNYAISSYERSKTIPNELKNRILELWKKVIAHRFAEESSIYLEKMKNELNNLQIVKAIRDHELLEQILKELSTSLNDLEFLLKNFAAFEVFKIHIKYEEKVLFD
jgi:hypothetical protein